MSSIIEKIEVGGRQIEIEVRENSLAKQMVP